MRRFLLLLSTLASAFGQWPNFPSGGLARTPDGKPNLSAPAPKTADGRPDLTGVWLLDFGKNLFDVVQDLKPSDIQTWAEELHQQRLATPGKDRWTMTCLPGGPAIGLDRQIAKIVQTPQLILIIYEDLTYRQIFLDGRELPKDPNPTWMGYSIGRWQGESLVVESSGFNDRTWLDYEGHPHTEALRITERYRRTDLGHIDLEIIYSDPHAYAKSWTIRGKLNLADTELIESVCAENEKDRSHLVANEAMVSLPEEILAKYAGNYEGVPPGGRSPMPVPVTLSRAGLTVDFGGVKFLLKPLSATTFSSTSGAVIQFVRDESGVITHLVLHSIEFELTAARKKSP
jgi:hypothetical protein